MKKHFSFPFFVFALVASAALLFCVPKAFALDQPGILYPVQGGNVLDQPFSIVGNAPANSTVYFWIDNTFIGATKTKKPASKKATIARFSLTYNKKRLTVGAHTLKARVAKGGVTSEYATLTFSVPKQWYRKLDGKMVKTQYWNQLPFAVMIENTPAARPQAGLSQASVVYETLAEGGVTRFLAIFPQSDKPTKIGPIRSSRPYYVDWAKEYDGLYIHAGGSPDAYAQIKKDLVRSYDGLSKTGAKYTYRICYGVHCLFSDKTKLQKLINDYRLVSLNAKSQGWKFKNGASLSERPKKSTTITIDFNGKTYRASWEYNRATNSYGRKQAGVVARDRNNGKQIMAQNIIIQRVAKEKVLDRKGRISIKEVGSGKGILFRDGKQIQITWKKKSSIDRTIFYLPNGQEVELNRGTTWVEVVPGTRAVTVR